MPEPWGNHENGRIPADALRQLEHATYNGQPTTAFRLREDASLALDRLLVRARSDGYDTDITDAYRDYDTQVRLKAEKGDYAATPGTSNHGWAMATDNAYAASSDSFGRWLWANKELAREHGWYPPAWTHDGTGIEEPWHWEYDDALDQHHNEQATSRGNLMYVCEKGDKGDAVEVLQVTLKALGANITPDGDYGDGTASAVTKIMGWDNGDFVSPARCRTIENKLIDARIAKRMAVHVENGHSGTKAVGEHSHTVTLT